VTKTEALAILQLCVLLGVGVFLATYDGASVEPVLRKITPTVRIDTERPIRVVDDLDAGVAEEAWLPLERLEYMEGPWRTEDAVLLVSVANRGEPAAGGAGGDAYEAAGWRLTIEWEQGPPLVCGLYLALQYAAPPATGLPWRLGYCRGRDVDPQGPALATRVSLLRSPGADYLRLVLGTEIDVLLYQVE
jgi:hypothetical protein